MQGWCNGDQMKYGIYFLVLAALMLSIAIQFGGWYWTMIYPASSFAIVAIATWASARGFSESGQTASEVWLRRFSSSLLTFYTGDLAPSSAGISRAGSESGRCRPVLVTKATQKGIAGNSDLCC